jgi:hypothetical protein
LEVNLKLLEETKLTKQACAYGNRIREAHVQRYRIQPFHDKIHAMKVRHFFRAGYALEGQPWHRLDLNAEHATDIRMEQANLRAGINQGDYVLVSVSID